MLIAKRHAVGTMNSPNIATLEIIIQKCAAPDTARLPIWKRGRNLSGIVAVIRFRVFVSHISA